MLFFEGEEPHLVVGAGIEAPQVKPTVDPTKTWHLAQR
jgi:hypothetical protein